LDRGEIEKIDNASKRYNTGRASSNDRTRNYDTFIREQEIIDKMTIPMIVMTIPINLMDIERKTRLFE
jgi:hypothetical protein